MINTYDVFVEDLLGLFTLFNGQVVQESLLYNIKSKIIERINHARWMFYISEEEANYIIKNLLIHLNKWSYSAVLIVIKLTKEDPRFDGESTIFIEGKSYIGLEQYLKKVWREPISNFTITGSLRFETD